MLNLSSQSFTLSFRCVINILEWIHQNFTSINCLKIKSLNQLKTGVIIAQILIQILPDNYHQILLTQIQLNNLNTDTCIHNFQIILCVVLKYISVQNISDVMSIAQYSAEGLYYRQQELQKFMNNILVKIWQRKKQLNPNSKSLKKQVTNNKQMLRYQDAIAAHLITGNECKTKQQSQVKNEKIRNMVISGKKQCKYSNSNMNVSQLSDINNHSSIQIANLQTNQQNVTNTNINGITHIKNNNIINVQFNSCSQFTQQLHDQQPVHQQIHHEHLHQISSQEIRLLQQWVNGKLGNCPIQEPHRLLGQLINSIFCSSRLNNYVIKEAHFQHGPIFVYRKALHFLINSQSAQRVQKNNVLSVMKGIQEEGVIREGQYWRVIKDLYIYEMNKVRYKSVSRNSSCKNKSSKKLSHKVSTQKQQQKQNRSINRKGSIRTLSKCKTSKQSIIVNINQNKIKDITDILPRLFYNVNDSKQAQQWISKVLGYQHTLAKAKNYEGFVGDNPLLNGTLVGSIIMRLKIGKPLINKIPNNMAYVRKNWDQINKITSLRGYQSLKKLMAHLQNLQKYRTDELVNYYLSVLKQLKDEHIKKNPQQKHRTKDLPSKKPKQNTNCNECVWSIKTKQNLSIQNIKLQKKQLKQWLLRNISIQIQHQYLTITQLTDICRNLLNINIYRQVTQKIQINNVQKILGELRRIGLGDYYHVTKEIVMGSNDDIRWKIIWDLKWIVQGKIQFCHV